MDVKVVVFTVFAIMIDCVLLFHYMDSHTIKKSKIVHAIVMYLLFFLTNYKLGNMDIPFLVRTVYNLIMIVFIGFFFYEKISIKSIGKEAIIFILLLGISELSMIPVVFFMTGDYDTQIFIDSNHQHLWLFSISLSRLIATVLFKISRRIQEQSYFKLTREELIILYLPLGFFLTAFLVAVKFVFDFKINKSSAVLLLVITLLLISSILLHMLFFEKYMHGRDSEKEIKMLKQKNRLQYEYYKKQIEAFENIRILYHDLKNHILLVQNDSDYHKEIGKKLKEYGILVNTGSDILNALLWQKSTEAIEKGIETETLIEELDLSFIDDMDLCSIVGNILDNAIEACSEVDRSCIPEINIRIAKINNFVVFKVENDCIANTRRKSRVGKGFETTKSEKDIHGIGLLSVTKAVEKYDGNCEFDCNNNKFCSQIIIPIPIMR